MSILLDYQNREVRLTEERLTHILAHPEMVGMQAQIAETLKHPKLVRQSRSDESVGLFYRFYTQTAIGDKWLCVVVKYLPADAFIVTLTSRISPKKEKTYGRASKSLV